MDFNKLDSAKRTTLSKLLRSLNVKYGYKTIMKKGQYGILRKYNVLDIGIAHLKEAIIKVKELPDHRPDKNGLITYRGSYSQYTLKTLNNLIQELRNE